MYVCERETERNTDRQKGGEMEHEVLSSVYMFMVTMLPLFEDKS